MFKRFLLFEIPLLYVLDKTIGEWENEILAWIAIVIVHVIFYVSLLWIGEKLTGRKCKNCGHKVSLISEEYIINEMIVRKAVENEKKIDVQSSKINNHDRYVGTIKENVMTDFKKVQKRIIHKCPLCGTVASEDVRYEEYEI